MAVAGRFGPSPGDGCGALGPPLRPRWATRRPSRSGSWWSPCSSRRGHGRRAGRVPGLGRAAAAAGEAAVPARLPSPAFNVAKGVLGVVTGEGTARAAASVMALGLDPRFDLRRAYWLVAGIAGADPEDMSGARPPGPNGWSTATSPTRSTRARRRRGWPTGYLPLDRTRPYQRPAAGYGSVYRLDPGLAAWAYRLTRDTPLPDSPALRTCGGVVGFPRAQQPPAVIRGDNLAAMTFGTALCSTGGPTAGSATGRTAGASSPPARRRTPAPPRRWPSSTAGRADARRLLVLRTASNPSMQYPGITAAAVGGRDRRRVLGYLPALEAAYRVGAGWSRRSRGLGAVRRAGAGRALTARATIGQLALPWQVEATRRAVHVPRCGHRHGDARLGALR